MNKSRRQIIEQTEIAPGIFDLRLEAADIARDARPGQFLNLYCADGARLLPRPISVCEAEADAVRLVYRVSGAGTKEFSALGAGDTVDVLGPLGNGFPVEEAAGKKLLLIGGGIGIPPLLFAAQEAAKRGAEVTAALGFKDKLFLIEDFSRAATLLVAMETPDAAAGLPVAEGTVLDAIRAQDLAADLVFACGPAPMLAAARDRAEETGTPAWLSLEERMACGVGACLACVCRTKETDAHSHVNNRRVCKDGPVFRAGEVIL